MLRRLLPVFFLFTSTAMAADGPPWHLLPEQDWGRSAHPTIPSPDIRIGDIRLILETTKLHDLQRAGLIGTISFYGDAATAIAWGCWSTPDAPHWRVYPASGEIEGNETIGTLILEPGQPSPACPVRGNGTQFVLLGQTLPPVLTPALLTQRFGKPSEVQTEHGETLQHWRYLAPATNAGLGFQTLTSLFARSKGTRLLELAVTRTTAN